jgi:membrane protein DedA with SNARE-associated domain
MHIERLILQNGAYFYLIAFAWTFLEGETIVLFAGFAAAQGLINPVLLLFATWLGTFSGDQLYFWIGRFFGLRLLRRFPPWRHGVERALSWLERYNAGFILSFRFIYGIRNISSFAMGLSAINWKRFLSLNFLAAALWAAIFISFGYFLGHIFRAALGDIARSFTLVMLGGFLVLLTASGLFHRWQRRRHSAFAARAAAPSSRELAGGAGQNPHKAADLKPQRRIGAPCVDRNLGEAVPVFVPERGPRRQVGKSPGAREEAAARLKPRP